MYGYQEFNELLPEHVLQKITQQEIFEFVLKDKFDFHKRYCSPFRDDKNPKCRFEERPDGTIVFVDFGERNFTGRTHRNCFRMVMESETVNLSGAIKIVCEAFNLSSDVSLYNKVEVNSSYTVKEKNSLVVLEYDKRPIPLKSDIWFWSQYLITMKDLAEDNVFCISRFFINSPKGRKIFTPYKFCYAIDFVDKVKIYQPFGGNYKWITNCDEDNIGNFDNLPATGHTLIVQKSYKDHRIIRNCIPESNVIWFQNEGCIPSSEIIKNLCERFEQVIIFFDNDESGIKAAFRVMDAFNEVKPGVAKVTYLPKKRKHKQLFGHYLKDPGEFIQKEGRQDLIKVLKTIGIHGKDT